jgi:hypothetical protein
VGQLVLAVGRSQPSPAKSGSDQEGTNGYTRATDDRPQRLPGHEGTAYEADPLTEPDHPDREKYRPEDEEDAHPTNIGCSGNCEVAG